LAERPLFTKAENGLSPRKAGSHRFTEPRNTSHEPPRLVPFDPTRKPPPDADMSFVDPPNHDEPREPARWLLPALVAGIAVWGAVIWMGVL
jgi:hypothetical protein